jgi:lipopolysaccharide/colanic/teichoic acid biosynthesis glycosyltransferase
MMRRLIDIVVAALVGVLTFPVMLVLVLLVRAQMGSPVLFRQRRTGWKGREFSIVKFRTMRPEAYPGQPDPERDTPLGRVLRGTSLDELPQVWNVLRGEMSLIGPRPTLPEQVVHYSERQRGRLAIRPGITGWAQVNGRNSISWPERIELDLWYIAHRSLALDLKVIWLTLMRFLRPHGVTAEGGINPGFPIPETEHPSARSGLSTPSGPAAQFSDVAPYPHRAAPRPPSPRLGS